MAFSEKIKLIFDIDDGPGVKSLKNLKSSVADADGAFGKMKAGGAGIGSMLSDNMGPAALGAGAALGAFAVKAVGAFVDTATAARELGDAVGLSTEDASRWIAIGDDMEVSAEGLTAAFGKVGKSLDSGKWEKYGVETRTATGSIRSTNDVLLDSFDMLGKIENATERAKVGNELFGKGYVNLAPMIGKTRDEYEGMLDSVEGGQVITKEEEEKAERMRLAQDALADAMQEVTLAVGGFVAELAPMIEALSSAVMWLSKVSDAGQGLIRTLAGLDGPTKGVMIGMRDVEVNALGAETGMRHFSDAAYTASSAALDAQVKTDALNTALVTLNGNLDQRAAARTFEEAMVGYRSSLVHSEEQTDAYIGKLRDTTVALNNIPDEVKTQMIAALDEGNVAWVESRLSFLARDRNIVISGQIVGSDLRNALEGRAAGGPVAAHKAFVVGERGPEILQMGSTGGRIIPNHALAGGGSVTLVFNAPVMSDRDFIRQVGDGLIDAMRRGEIPGTLN